MVRLSAFDGNVADIEADALILGIIEGGEVTAHASLSESARAAMTEAAHPLDPSAKVGATTILPSPIVKARRVVLVGLGEGNDADFREAAGAASRECGKRPSRIVVALPALTDPAQAAVAEGVVLGSYSFDKYRTPKGGEAPPDVEWLIAGASTSALTRARVVADAVNSTRDLVNTAPRDLYPESFAEEARAAASAVGVDVRVWDVAHLEEEGFGGLLAVGMGSTRPPRLVRLGWAPAGAKETVALVGKGITFEDGDDVTIAATGYMVYEALLAHEELKKQGIHARVLDIHTIKPIDRELLLKAARETGAVVTAEEHQVMGGFGSAVAEVLVQECTVPMEFVGIKDRFGESGTPDELLTAFGCRHTDIEAAVHRVLTRKANSVVPA